MFATATAACCGAKWICHWFWTSDSTWGSAKNFRSLLEASSLQLNRRGPVWDTVETVHPSLQDVVLFREQRCPVSTTWLWCIRGLRPINGLQGTITKKRQVLLLSAQFLYEYHLFLCWSRVPASLTFFCTSLDYQYRPSRWRYLRGIF